MPTLGKRKRDTAVARRKDIDDSEQVEGTSTDYVNSIFRKYFETTFDPLATIEPATPSFEEDESGEDGLETEVPTEQEFIGFSDEDENTTHVEVIDTTIAETQEESDSIDKIFKKSFMSSKPPRDIDQSKQTTIDSTSTKASDQDEAMNLKNDLDLQRLLRESHLLSQSRGSSSNTTSTTSLSGKHRHQSMDMRLQDLGSRKSIFKQDKMPMNHRKGIQSRVGMMEDYRRKEAKENGIVLEKPRSKNGTSHKAARRERGVDVPIVGKFKGGTLALSKRDVASIQGPAKSGKRRGRH